MSQSPSNSASYVLSCHALPLGDGTYQAHMASISAADDQTRTERLPDLQVFPLNDSSTNRRTFDARRD
jgi:hypothetical protein